MTTLQTISLAILVLLALAGGTYIHRRTSEDDPLYGGVISRATNFLASALLVAIAPSVLCTLFVFQPNWLGELRFIFDWADLLEALFIAVIMTGLALALLLVQARFEQDATRGMRTQTEDRGWTEEDARSSGL